MLDNKVCKDEWEKEKLNMSPHGFRWLNKKNGITCSVSNTAENSAHTAALCNLLNILQKAYEAYLYRGILFVIHELRISLAVL